MKSYIEEQHLLAPAASSSCAPHATAALEERANCYAHTRTMHRAVAWQHNCAVGHWNLAGRRRLMAALRCMALHGGASSHMQGYQCGYYTSANEVAVSTSGCRAKEQLIVSHRP